MADAPFVLMIAGPNGSGKSTLTRQMLASGIDLGTYINPDDIAAALDGAYGEREGPDHRRGKASAVHRAKGKLLLRDGDVASFEDRGAQERPSSGFHGDRPFRGHESPEINKLRVRQRVALGRHDVPEEKIVQRYWRTLELLTEAVSQADRAVLFDNTYRPSDEAAVRLSAFCELTRAAGGFTRKFSSNARMPRWGALVLSEIPEPV